MVASSLAASPGADVNGRSPAGWCAIHYAAATANADLLRALIDAGADVNVADERDASRVLMTDFVTRKPTVATPDALRNAFMPDPMARLRTMGCAPLHYAILANRPDVVRLLAEAGARVDQRNADGAAPLELAPAADQAVLLQALEGMQAEREEVTQRDEPARTEDSVAECHPRAARRAVPEPGVRRPPTQRATLFS